MKKTYEKKDIYTIVNKKFEEALEAGTNPWVKPWIGRETPFNITTGKKYSLLNQLCLTRPGAYATFKQWSDMGGRVKKGSKAEEVCFWKILEKTETEEDGTTKKVKIPILQYFNVFNFKDVEFPEGKEPKKVKDYLTALEENHGLGFEHERHEKAEEVLNAYITREGINFLECESDRACYSSMTDTVQIPLLEQFPILEEYYSTKAHELIHSTGHKNRLDRPLGNKFGSEKYSREELIAEIGSAYFMNLLGLETPDTFNNSASYVDGWRSLVKKDPKAVVVATGRAQKALEYLFGVKTLEEFELA